MADCAWEALVVIQKNVPSPFKASNTGKNPSPTGGLKKGDWFDGNFIVNNQ